MADSRCPGCGAVRQSGAIGHHCPGYPYLGLVPAPSKPWGVALIASSIGCAVVALAQAGLYWQRADLDRRWADHQSTSASMLTNSHELTALAVVTLVAIVGFVVLDVVWRRRRRPIDTLRQWGEACVESPMKAVTPLWIRVGWVVLAGAFLVSLVNGQVHPTTLPSAYATARLWSMVSRATVAVMWLLVVAMVMSSDQHLADRLARSGSARANPSTVGYIPTLVPRDRRRLGLGPAGPWAAPVSQPDPPYATAPYATPPYATAPYATPPYATAPYATPPYATPPSGPAGPPPGPPTGVG